MDRSLFDALIKTFQWTRGGQYVPREDEQESLFRVQKMMQKYSTQSLLTGVVTGGLSYLALRQVYPPSTKWGFLKRAFFLTPFGFFLPGIVYQRYVYKYIAPEILRLQSPIGDKFFFELSKAKPNHPYLEQYPREREVDFTQLEKPVLIPSEIPNFPVQSKQKKQEEEKFDDFDTNQDDSYDFNWNEPQEYDQNETFEDDSWDTPKTSKPESDPWSLQQSNWDFEPKKPVEQTMENAKPQQGSKWNRNFEEQKQAFERHFRR